MLVIVRVAICGHYTQACCVAFPLAYLGHKYVSERNRHSVVCQAILACRLLNVKRLLSHTVVAKLIRGVEHLMQQNISNYSVLSRGLGWGIALVASCNALLSSTMPRTSKELPLRAELREIHMWIGLLLLCLVIGRLVMWFREGRVAAPAGMPRSVHAQGRIIAFTVYMLLLLAGLLGIGFAWGSGYKPPIIPMAFADNYYLWKFSGYFHSGASFTFLLFNLTGVIFATYVVFRYKIDWLKALPEPLIIQFFFGMMSTFYALVNTGSSKAPGVQILLVIAVLVWGLSVWRRKSPKSLVAA